MMCAKKCPQSSTATFPKITLPARYDVTVLVRALAILASAAEPLRDQVLAANDQVMFLTQLLGHGLTKMT